MSDYRAEFLDALPGDDRRDDDDGETTYGEVGQDMSTTATVWEAAREAKRLLALAVRDDGAPFRYNRTAFTGHAEGALDLGELPDYYSWHAGARAADYVMFSYATPIAWRSGETWLIPAVRYSLTTAQHLLTARSMISDMRMPTESMRAADDAIPVGWKRATDGVLIYREAPERGRGGWGRD